MNLVSEASRNTITLEELTPIGCKTQRLTPGLKATREREADVRRREVVAGNKNKVKQERTYDTKPEEKSKAAKAHMQLCTA